MSAASDERGPRETYGKPPRKRRKVPTILQMEAVECGAAALAMILAHHGRWVPLEELRVECGVSRDGSRASNVMKAARKYGLKAKGFRKEIDGLYELDLPVILFWNMNHFVVLEGFRGGKAYIADPAQGPRQVSMEELDGAFSGVVLTFAPGEDFAPGGSKPSMMAALGRRLQGSEQALVFAILCGLFLVVPGLVVPTFARVFVDEYLIGGHHSLLKPLLLGMGLTAIVRMALTWLQEAYLLRLETKLALSESARFFAHILRLPASYFGQRFAGEIGSRVAINDKVAGLLSGRLATTVIDCGLIVFYAALMFVYDVGLTAIVLFLAALNVAAVKFGSAQRVDAARHLLLDQGKLTGTAMNGLSMIETLKATGSEGEFFGRWAGYQAKALKAEQTLARITLLVQAVPPLVSTLTTTAVLWVGGLKVMDGQLSVGMLVAYQTLMASFMKPLNTLVSFGSDVQELEADMNRLDDVLRYPQDPRYTRVPAIDDLPAVKLSGKVELEGVTFGYSPLDPPLISDFTLSVEPGQRIALVGGSGSGKSTVARLIAGLYEPWDGKILFDGHDRRHLPAELVSSSLAVVDQDIFLFGGTVRDNIALWDSTLPIAQVTAAARDAAIDDVVESRDGAYASPVEELGGNFSGGQRQRLEIARALVGNPTMLVLDEATSALDPTTEVMIDDHLRRRGCTCIIVAHRLSTIRDCDEILVLRRGKIVQRGTHDAMKDAPGPYAELIRE
ncbi:MAG: NHLP family bacteriocin export ABC transporter peptidase/permease/ATPase subunit [Acidobacteriota bacterium]